MKTRRDEFINILDARLQIQQPDDIPAGDFLKCRVGKQAFLVQIFQEVAQWQFLFIVADIRSETKLVLKFVEEFYGIVRIPCQRIVAARSGQVAPHVRIFSK